LHADDTGLLAQSAGGGGFLMWMVLRVLHLDDDGFLFLGTQILEM
jgi:hypothetical protein